MLAKSRWTVLFLAIVCVLSGTVFAPLSAIAVVPVNDAQNILQQLKTYQQEAMTVVNTAKQIELQYKELLNLPNQILNSYKSLLGNEIGELQSILKNTTGMLNPDKKAEDLFISLFKPAGTLTKTTVTSSTAAAASSGISKSVDTVNYESFEIVKGALGKITQTQKNIDDLMTLNASSEGSKQTGQIQNMLLAEQAKIMQQQNLIRAAEVNARVSYYQQQNEYKRLAAAIGEKAATSIENMDTSCN